MEQIGKRLRSLREGIRLTQVQMAQILGVSNPVSTDLKPDNPHLHRRSF